MIVAPGAGGGQSEQPASDDIDAVVNDLVREKVVARTDRQKPERSK